MLYGIVFLSAPPAIDSWHETFIADPLQTYKKIHDLDSDTMYMLSIWAETRVGNGHETIKEETTVSEMGMVLFELLSMYVWHCVFSTIVSIAMLW